MKHDEGYVECSLVFKRKKKCKCRKESSIKTVYAVYYYFSLFSSEKEKKPDGRTRCIDLSQV